MTSLRVRLSASVRSALLAEARSAAHGEPTEICGVLAGRRGDETRPPFISTFRPVATVAADPRRAYELDPAETVRAIDALEAAGHALLGFYHSHPVSPATPSRADHEQAAWPGYLYAIVSVLDAEIAVFEWAGETFEPRSVAVVTGD